MQFVFELEADKNNALLASLACSRCCLGKKVELGTAFRQSSVLVGLARVCLAAERGSGLPAKAFDYDYGGGAAEGNVAEKTVI